MQPGLFFLLFTLSPSSAGPANFELQPWKPLQSPGMCGLY